MRQQRRKRKKKRCWKEKKHWTALIGLGCTAACLVLFGPDSFMVPAMAAILIALTLFRKPITREGGFAQ